MMDFWRRTIWFIAILLSLLWLGLAGWVIRQSFPALSPQVLGPAAVSPSPGEKGDWAPLFHIPGVEFKFYKVEAHDTYAALARKFGLKETSLRSLNQANDGSNPTPQSSLLIPSKDGIFHVM